MPTAVTRTATSVLEGCERSSAAAHRHTINMLPLQPLTADCVECTVVHLWCTSKHKLAMPAHATAST
jgi:hypothetical protein